MTDRVPIPSIADAVAYDLESVLWKTLGDGIELAHLLKDRERDYTVVLLRFARGAQAVQHRHPHGEQYLILAGDLVDGGKTYSRGAFINHPPGSIHAPLSPNGALILVSWFGKLLTY